MAIKTAQKMLSFCICRLYVCNDAYEYQSKECAVYAVLGYDIDGHQDILRIWLNEMESKHSWLQIFDGIGARGVEDIFFISMDGVSGLEDGGKEIFKGMIVQRCIVHLIRNSLKYVPSKDFKKFTTNLKLIYEPLI